MVVRETKQNAEMKRIMCFPLFAADDGTGRAQALLHTSLLSKAYLPGIVLSTQLYAVGIDEHQVSQTRSGTVLNPEGP